MLDWCALIFRKRPLNSCSNGCPGIRELWESDWDEDPLVRQPLFIDSGGMRTGVDPTFVVFDRDGPDLNVYANDNGTFNASQISVRVSRDGVTWVDASYVERTQYILSQEERRDSHQDGNDGIGSIKGPVGLIFCGIICVCDEMQML